MAINKFKIYMMFGLMLVACNEETNNQTETKTETEKQELNYSECYRLYGGSSDMSPWELAQAECLLQQNDYKKACDCMNILSK